MVGAATRKDVFGLVSTVIGERFRVDDLVAEGGFGVVYRATQVALDRRVALKVLKTPAAHDDATRAEFRERFEAEAKTIARLKHPNIVDVYDFAVSPLPSGELAAWMALEWVDGETLETRLARRRAEGLRGLPPVEALALLRPAVEALAFAHKEGVVHRDVKPANIMLSETDHGRRVRVLDFGIAKIVRSEEPAGSGRTRTGSVPAFSPAYAAPEQVTFSRTGPWTDVHALGLVLSELLTDEAPFPETDAAVHEQVMAPVRPTPASKGREVGWLEPIVARALAVAPGDRYRNAGELLAALEGPRSEAARPATATRAPGRKRMVAAAALGGAALMAVGIWSVRGRSTPAEPPVVASPPRPVQAVQAVAPPPAPAPESAPAPPVRAAAIVPEEPLRRPARPLHGTSRQRKPDPQPAREAKPNDLFDDTK
jgi:eukaryotic-like serine/threonine-protein kinase